MEDWTVVRYGRRRPRIYRPNWDQGRGGSQGRMDRASSFSFRRGAQTSQPNQPAPPPRFSRYPGSQYRSYAAVVQANPRPARRWIPSRASEPDIRRQPADPQLGKLIRKLHAVVRLVHHLQNVAPKSGKPEPRTISRMVEILSSMIKPAVPSQNTMDLITGNAKNWGYNTCLILMEHYEVALQDLLRELPDLLTPNWKEAFEVAIRWAKRNLPRLTQDVIDHAEALITSRVEKTTDLGQQQMGELATQTQVPQPKVVGTCVATMTEPQVPVSDRDKGTSQAEPPRDRREVRRRPRTAGGVILTADNYREELELLPVEDSRVQSESPLHNSMRTDLEALFDELEAEERAAEAQAAQADQSPRSVVAQVHWESTSDDEGQSFDYTTPPQPPRFQVTRHPNTQRKLTEWDLVVTKKWLIIGDSNLNRFPTYLNKDLQIECYPGSHFRHGQALMEKAAAPTMVTVEKVILAFGINSRDNKADTTIKNVQAALRATKRKFPYAEIMIPLVNYSPNLTEEAKGNLETLNQHIERNMPYIPLLPGQRFQTEVDDIHWTPETAEAMFDHWMACLNSNTP